ncbi:MAG: hypothetical protein JSR77_04330 [Planctomycetes bacterium]|nr:hypothetical protein [Planctomycetota bacterium]
MNARFAHILVLFAAALLAGCTPMLDERLVEATNVGRYGGARVALQKRLTNDRSDRAYILDRMRLLILTLADGSPDAAEEVANQTFSLLSTQGVNADRTVSSAVIHESVRIWKGEPFEQAMAYNYIALQKAMRGEWDNARAAASSSLFRLKDFSDNERGLTSEELARKAAAKDARAPGNGDQYLDHGYVVAKTDFALGYLMNGLANKAIGRDDEASDNFREAASVNPRLDGLARQLIDGQYNTVFVIDYQRGPVKIAYGTDNAFTRFQPRVTSDERTVSLTVAGGAPVVGPQACDVNAMAAKLMWNNLEDVRRAKSLLGNAMLIGGTAVAIGSNDDTAKWAGLGVALAGLLVKASASADTRYCEFLPRSVYVVPVTITQPDCTVSVSVAGDTGSGIVLTDMNPPRQDQRMQLRYVRLPPTPNQPWAASWRTMYANDRTAERVDGDTLPYIMGGRCVRFPGAETMKRYHDAGQLLDLTSTELEGIYREEGITFTVEDQHGESRKHILEGGDSLVCPLAGTAGYARLFGQLHEPYKPKGKALKEYLASHPQLAQPAPLSSQPSAAPSGN